MSNSRLDTEDWSSPIDQNSKVNNTTHWICIRGHGLDMFTLFLSKDYLPCTDMESQFRGSLKECQEFLNEYPGLKKASEKRYVDHCYNHYIIAPVGEYYE